MAFFSTPDGASLYFETFDFDNDHPVLVFLNGTAQTTRIWQAFAKRLGKKFRVLLYDARTQGQSRMGHQAPSLAQHAEDLTALLAHINVSRAHLVGFSHGASVACAVAARQPRLVDRLVLCCPANRSKPVYETMLKNWIQVLENEGLEAFARDQVKVVFSGAYLDKNPHVIRRIVESIVCFHHKANLLAQLKAMAAYPQLYDFPPMNSHRILLISAGRDTFLNRVEAEKLAAFHSAEHLHFPDLGHAVPLEASTAFSNTLSQFLGKG